MTVTLSTSNYEHLKHCLVREYISVGLVSISKVI